MITLHRFGHQAEPFELNQELIVTVEANPDTVITLATGHKIVVVESPEKVAQRVRDARAAVMVEALRRREAEPDRPDARTRPPRLSEHPAAVAQRVAQRGEDTLASVHEIGDEA